MKFSDGLWLHKKGYQIHYAAMAYEITHTDNAITVFATTTPIYNRAMTLGGVTLEITYTAVAEDVIRVQIVHHKGTLRREPKIPLEPMRGCDAVITEDAGRITMTAGKTSVCIRKGFDWGVTFAYGGKHLTGSGSRGMSYIVEDHFHAAARLAVQADDQPFNLPADPRTGYIREQLSLENGECIYGFGERFTPFVKNGQSVETWNADGGTCSEQSYKCVPFYLSSRSYGIYVHSTGNVSYEVASDTVSKVSFTLPGEELEYYLFAGDQPEKVLERYTDLTGKPALPPAETFGLWLSTSFTTDYDEKTVTSMIDGMRDRDIPLQYFHFDCFWMKGFEWVNFTWDPEAFPEPEAMLRRLHARGLHVCVWINPYVSQRSRLFEEGAANGYFLHDPDGNIFQSDLWQPGMAIIDLTDPAARDWYASYLKKLCRMGVDAIKTDFGERIPWNVRYHDGSDPIGMHNYYAYLYHQTVFQVLEEVYGKGKACLFARSASAGCQRFPVHWGGDCSAEFTSMAETLRGGLSLCASGFGFFSHDIGGFEQTASPDVYKRWCAFGLLSSHSRLHGSTSYRVPWAYEEDTPEDPENACAVLRFFTKLKGRLMPYLFAQAVHTARTGIPMMRAMVLSYADDPAVPYLDRQYMLGDALLCAPVMNAEGTADVYLPAGIWTDILTGEQFTGGRFYRRKCSFLEMPLLARENAILVYGDFRQDVVYDYLQDAEAVIYALGDGSSAETTVYDHGAEPLVTIRAVREGGVVRVTATPTDRSFTVTLHGTEHHARMGAGVTEILFGADPQDT